ncbi:hypothetical protein PTTG_03800 [Puccinia triticina 1-1 BBBD Race 1]|uniref:Secreted protein n=1 Tax=Puccinia triticina (isolate 1-1 / race 1 (BBBD)) TaxID=630390 RepID=A0A0C4ESM1_PUCT1|nr:hypothetical protein PTTG_03800 [Puccinia triticina 1-1 BBBD Race 1]WAR57903.1 hypothetical protein PtB15_5B133 [Puccinia triticina]
MKSTTSAIFLALSLSVVRAAEHTMCYDYFLNKDHCVHSSASTLDRCQAKDHSEPVKAFTMNPGVQNAKRSEIQGLERRYDTTRPSFFVAGGDGTCGFYNTTSEPGVCLWNGPEQDNPTKETAGWLNGAQKANCGKQIYIQRKGQPHTVQYVKVLDGCSFGVKTPDPGCFDIAVTLALFNLFKPSEKEKQDGKMYGGFTWDFNSLDGSKPESSAA